MHPTAAGLLDLESGIDGDAEAQFRSRGTAQHHFPMLLYVMLARAEANNYSSICSWQPHGRSFCIFDREKFVEQILPIYFRQTRFASFQRQLNLYGFYRMNRKGSDYRSYYHADFLRGLPDRAASIQRQKIKNDDESRMKVEPDFSTMDPMGNDVSREELDQILNVGMYDQLFSRAIPKPPNCNLYPAVATNVYSGQTNTLASTSIQEPFPSQQNKNAFGAPPTLPLHLSPYTLESSLVQSNTRHALHEASMAARHSHPNAGPHSPSLKRRIRQEQDSSSESDKKRPSVHSRSLEMSSEEIESMAHFLEDVDLDVSQG